MHQRLFNRVLLLLGTLACLVLPAHATWSIVVINTRTGEVAVGTATCLENFDLRRGVPVIYVGKGAAAAQSFLDTGGVNRRFIYNSFRTEIRTPEEILESLSTSDSGHQTRQYGIVAFNGAPVTFTGNGAGAHASGVTGQIGDYVYAIQGNILTGPEVVMAAEDAFRNTEGDLGQRMMAGMEAARLFGGDGRCSCPQGSATSCGAPPASFTKSAHVGTVVVARIGDTNGGCGGLGCARGRYYLNLNVIGDRTDPDPVFTLQERYDEWRANRIGRPDGILSEVTSVQSLPADGRTKRRVLVTLRDLEGGPLTTGGADVRVAAAEGERLYAGLGPVVDHGDGTYSFTLTAGTLAGMNRLAITAADDLVEATLYPYLEVETVAPQALHVGYETVSASDGVSLPFVVDVPERAHARYAILARLGGPPAGVGIASLGPLLLGRLDGDGRAERTFDAPPELLLDLAGQRLEWTGIVLGSPRPMRTNTVGLEVLP